jgi:hypothetical protein
MVAGRWIFQRPVFLAGKKIITIPKLKNTPKCTLQSNILKKHFCIWEKVVILH